MEKRIKAILFDLDGTLLPMNLKDFLAGYLPAISAAAAQLNEPARVGRWIMSGTAAMIAADGGGATCEDVFWEEFCRLSEAGREQYDPIFTAFYEQEFDALGALCPAEPRAAQIIAEARAKGLRCALATMPVFPRVATLKRIGWAGISPEDFEIITTYEICHASKPSLAYYREILDWMHLAPADCLMVGNDVGDDIAPALALGMDAFYLDAWPENRTAAPERYTGRGGYDALLEYVRRL
ncbi:MAG: HAD family hydrolase [Clostridiales bacterium]|nr:HAD family hydrolase [Clostridiales bacterium]